MKNTNWWLINGIWTILIGPLSLILSGSFSINALSGLGVGYALNLLIGIGLIMKSKLAFWVSLVSIGISFLSKISSLSSASQMNIDSYTILLIISLGLIIMLWQEIKKVK